MTEEDKARSGKLFVPGDPDLKAKKLRAHNLNLQFNALYEDQEEERSQILSQLVGKLGEGSFIQGPVFFHYGCHTIIGKNCFINFNFTVQDDADVTVGDDCNFGPNVTLVTPLHPMIPSERLSILRANGDAYHMCYAKPIHIGSNCWFGANVVVCPGVTIGDGCVIGAGSVVNRDIPPNSFAAGVPCRFIRSITDEESIKYHPELLMSETLLSD